MIHQHQCHSALFCSLFCISGFNVNLVFQVRMHKRFRSWNLEHDDLLSCISLPTLEARRDCLTVVQVFKILADLSSAPNVFIPHTHSDSRRNHSRALYIPFSCLTLCQRSFFHLGPKLWNKLPKNVASCVTLPSFKAAVRTIIMDKLSFVLSCLSFFFFLVL